MSVNKGDDFMTVYELPKICLSELKAYYLCEKNENVSWGELAEADNIPDEVIFDYYGDVYFVPEDFSEWPDSSQAIAE